MSDRKVLYVAHPVGGDVDGNIKRALRWLAYLRASDPANTYLCPWVAGLLSGEDDNDPLARERGLIDCEASVARLDGIVLCGGRISSGMDRELAVAKAQGGVVIDLTSMGAEPPSVHAKFDVGGDV